MDYWKVKCKGQKTIPKTHSMTKLIKAHYKSNKHFIKKNKTNYFTTFATAQYKHCENILTVVLYHTYLK